MATRKLESLIQALAERTRKSSLGWKVGSREDTFVWSGSGASVLLMSRDNDGQSPWLIRLVDDSGRVIEDEEISLYENMGQTVSDLYADARAEALDISAPMTEATASSRGGIELLADDLVEPAMVAKYLEAIRRAEQWMKVCSRGL